MGDVCVAVQLLLRQQQQLDWSDSLVHWSLEAAEGEPWAMSPSAAEQWALHSEGAQLLSFGSEALKLRQHLRGTQVPVRVWLQWALRFFVSYV